MSKQATGKHTIDSIADWYKIVRPTEFQDVSSLYFSKVVKALRERDGETINDMIGDYDTMVREDIFEESLGRAMYEMEESGATKKEIDKFCQDMQNLIGYTEYGIECAKKVLAEIKKERKNQKNRENDLQK